MKQIIQDLKNGETCIVEVPMPIPKKGEILIKTNKSLISFGTEKMLIDFGNANYLNKALQQPDKVRDVINKVKTDGFISTYSAVKSKLNQPISLGYSNVGIVIDIGQDVDSFSIGDRVVSNGIHAEIVSVNKNLCAKIPDVVSDDQACFTVLSAIGLHGIRLAKPTIGEFFVVYGLGLIGLLTSQILLAHGCQVLAIDIDKNKVKLANDLGVKAIISGNIDELLSITKSYCPGGADGVIITATNKSNEIIKNSAQICRKRGRIIMIGSTGMNMSRDDFYEKELKFQVSCSYGPGRYDKSYEKDGNDYPIGYVRWTEQRNFESILKLMEIKKIDISKLISDRIDFKNAPKLYDQIAKGKVGLGIILEYPSNINQSKNIKVNEFSNNYNKSSNPIIAVIGSGNHATRELIPAIKKTKAIIKTLVSSNGLSSTIEANKSNISVSSTDFNQVLSDDKINTVVIATQHNTHAEIVLNSIKNKKNIFVEKPLALNENELEEIRSTISNSNFNNHLVVGFNRRFSSHTIKMKSLLDSVKEPKTFIITVNAGSVDNDHWVHDYEIGGGRIIGEACHHIDLMRFLAGTEICSVSATKIKNSSSGVTEDKAAITLNFNCGSFGTIFYLANGSKSFPKERIEVFVDGKVAQIDNFRKLNGFGWNNFRGMRTLRQDKGQHNCIKEFIHSIEVGKPLIPLNEIFEVSSRSIEAANILRSSS